MPSQDLPRSTPLIAEELLLLLTDDATGRPMTGFWATLLWARPLFGGALLAELVLDGSVARPRASGMPRWAPRPLAVITPPATSPAAPSTTSAADAEPSPLLTHAREVVRTRPRVPHEMVPLLGRDLQQTLTAQLAERGLLVRRPRRRLGIFRTTAWQVHESVRQRDLRERLRSALVHGTALDPRSTALLGLLHTSGQTHRVLATGLTTREVTRRAAVISQDVWAAKAVKHSMVTTVVAATISATVTAIVAATVLS